MTNLEERVFRLEALIRAFQQQAASLQTQVGTAAQGLYQMQTPPQGGGGTVAISPALVTGGGISASNGTIAGSGSVTLYTGPTLVSTGIVVTCYSVGTTAGGVANGTWIMVGQDQSSNWWLISVDCQ
jgi:hypothetical protein